MIDKKKDKDIYTPAYFSEDNDMDIIDRIDGYLTENQLQKDMDSLMKTIKSSSTTSQLTAAAKSAEEFVNKYGKESLMKSMARFFGGKEKNPNTKELLDKFGDAIKKQRGKIDHLELQKRVRDFREKNVY